MFDILTQYLFEFKQLALSSIGVFELRNREASTDLASSTISAPSWAVGFMPYTDDAQGSTDPVLLSWLAVKQNKSMADTEDDLTRFISDLQTRLNNGELVQWPQLGVLQKRSEQILFEPDANCISPFTDVKAKKIIRDDASHQTLVGDRETTTSQMREQLLLPDERRRSGSIAMWVLLGVALVAAAWFFSQKGCNPSATGNQQKVESTQSGDTYKLR